MKFNRQMQIDKCNRSNFTQKDLGVVVNHKLPMSNNMILLQKQKVLVKDTFIGMLYLTCGK